MASSRLKILLCFVLAITVFTWAGFHLLPSSPAVANSLTPMLVADDIFVQNLNEPSGVVAGSRERISAVCTNCKTGVPCEHEDQVDLRIMIITFNRPQSLAKTLNSLHYLDTLGDKVKVEIWIDRDVKGLVSKTTVDIAQAFVQQWRNGTACIHVQDRNANIRGQWIDTWRPRQSLDEMGLIVEDDIDLSPYAYRWLRAVHRRYKLRDDVSGYTLQMENVKFKSGAQGPMIAPQTDTAFMYPVTGTWGFSPHPLRWREFQDWFHVASHNETFHPYVPGIISTTWYKAAEKKGTADRVWAIWHHYFNYNRHLYCVYCNLRTLTGKKDVLLSANRRESGLHFSHNSDQSAPKLLMQTWETKYTDLPDKIIQFYYNGTIARRV